MNINAVQKVEFKCRHCGQPSHSAEFCCSGCSMVYALIHESGLDEFYTRANGQLQPPVNFVCSSQKTWDTSDLQVISENMFRANFYVQNITCSACVWLLEKMPKLFPEIKSVRIDSTTRVGEVTFTNPTDIDKIISNFRSLGFSAFLVRANNEHTAATNDLRQWYLRVAVAVASWMASMHVGLTLIAGALSSMDLQTSRGLGIISTVLATPSLFYSALPFYRGAYLALKNKTLTLDVLVSVSIFTGLILSLYNIFVGRNEFYFDALTMLVAFLLISRLLVRYLEINLARQQQLMIQKLLVTDSKIKIGSRVVCNSGEPFTCDGLVIKGASGMEASWLTGESVPSHIGIGDKVYCGAINIGDQIEIECTAVGKETRVGKVLSMLNSVERSKFIEFSRRSETLLISLLFVGISGFAVFGLSTGTFHKDTLVALLLITCPCALGVAIPMTIATAVLQAFKNGIFIKSGSSLERIAEISTIVFDKTGTVSSSRPIIRSEAWFYDHLKSVHLKPEEAQQVLAAMLARSEHVMTRSLKEKYNNINDQIYFDSFNASVGKGIEAVLKHKHYRLGSAAYTGATGDSVNRSSLFFSINQTLVAEFKIEAEIAIDDQECVLELNKIYKTYLLSGDSHDAVLRAANILGIESHHTFWQKTPEQKLDFIKDVTRNEKVMMVGDGINDTLAFKSAHVSVGVVGAAHVALEVSDIYLSKPGLKQLQQLLRASHKLRKVIFFNFAWAVGFNIIGTYFVLSGYLGPVVCALLMPLSSAIVVVFSTTQKYFLLSPPQEGSI